MSLLKHLIWIPPSFPPRWNTHYSTMSSLWSSWLFPCGWHKLLNKVLDLSTQENLICVHPYQNGPQCRSSAPCQYKPLPEVFPDRVVYVLAPTNLAGWVESSFLDVSSYSAALFPFLSNMQISFWINGIPLAFVHDHDRLLAVQPALVAVEVVCCGSITNLELFLFHGGKEHSLLFLSL